MVRTVTLIAAILGMIVGGLMLSTIVSKIIILFDEAHLHQKVMKEKMLQVWFHVNRMCFHNNRMCFHIFASTVYVFTISHQPHMFSHQQCMISQFHINRVCFHSFTSTAYVFTVSQQPHTFSHFRIAYVITSFRINRV
jgi:hypothetical protein